MCGIVSISSNARPIPVPALVSAVRRLAHRGPESQGLWISKDSRVGLGHRRLSIVGLQTGKQPIPSEDGSIVIVVNGMFYDYKRIRIDLKKRGHYWDVLPFSRGEHH